jgi:hypothetical protein
MTEVLVLGTSEDLIFSITKIRSSGRWTIGINNRLRYWRVRCNWAAKLKDGYKGRLVSAAITTMEFILKEQSRIWTGVHLSRTKLWKQSFPTQVWLSFALPRGPFEASHFHYKAVWHPSSLSQNTLKRSTSNSRYILLLMTTIIALFSNIVLILYSSTSHELILLPYTSSLRFHRTEGTFRRLDWSHI